jgi:hypothetical protein
MKCGTRRMRTTFPDPRPSGERFGKAVLKAAASYFIDRPHVKAKRRPPPPVFPA